MSNIVTSRLWCLHPWPWSMPSSWPPNGWVKVKHVDCSTENADVEEQHQPLNQELHIVTLRVLLQALIIFLNLVCVNLQRQWDDSCGEWGSRFFETTAFGIDRISPDCKRWSMSTNRRKKHTRWLCQNMMKNRRGSTTFPSDSINLSAQVVSQHKFTKRHSYPHCS